MKRFRTQKPIGDIDLTSFSDIAFLMIVFFVLTTTFVQQMGASLTIPSSTSDPEQKSEREYPTVNISAEQIALDERAVTMDELRQALRAMKLAERKDEERFVVLESMPDVDFERYFQVVTAIAHAGGVLALAEEPQEGAAP